MILRNRDWYAIYVGELFDSVESLKQHREAEITNEEAGADVIKI